MRIKKFNESIDNHQKISIRFVEWAADYLFEPMYNRIGFDNYISQFTGEERWIWSSINLRKRGIERLMDIELYEKFCEENNIEITTNERSDIILKEKFEPLDFFKFICKLNLIKLNWNYKGVKQPFYWTNLKEERVKYSTEELYNIFLDKQG
jgi:hypothetical protein